MLSASGKFEVFIFSDALNIMPSVLDSFGECVLKSVDYDSFSVSTPEYVAASVPIYAFSKMLEGGKYRKFKGLMDNMQTSLFNAFIENKPFPVIENERIEYLNVTSEKVLKAFNKSGCVAGVGDNYLVYVINVPKNIQDIKDMQKEMKDENNIRLALFEGHKKRISEIVENTLISMEKSFDVSAMYV